MVVVYSPGKGKSTEVTRRVTKDLKKCMYIHQLYSAECDPCFCKGPGCRA